MLMSVCTMGIATLHAAIAHESLAKKKKTTYGFLGMGESRRYGSQITDCVLKHAANYHCARAPGE